MHLCIDSWAHYEATRRCRFINCIIATVVTIMRQLIVVTDNTIESYDMNGNLFYSESISLPKIDSIAETVPNTSLGKIAISGFLPLAKNANTFIAKAKQQGNVIRDIGGGIVEIEGGAPSIIKHLLPMTLPIFITHIDAIKNEIIKTDILINNELVNRTTFEYLNHGDIKLAKKTIQEVYYDVEGLGKVKMIRTEELNDFNFESYKNN